MSNYKKRQQTKAVEQSLEKKATKREREILGRLKGYVAEGHPLHKQEQMWFFSGATWADENPDKKAVRKWLLIGCGAGIIATLIIVAMCLILKIEGIL